MTLRAVLPGAHVPAILCASAEGQQNNEHDPKLLHTLNSMIEMQKQLLKALGTATSKYDKVESELTKISRQGLKLQGDLAEERGDVLQTNSRLDGLETRLAAIASRIDAIGGRLDAFGSRMDIGQQA